MGGPDNRMSNKLIMLIMMMAVLPFVSAQAIFDIPTFQQDTNQTLSIPCHFNGNVCPPAAYCNATIINPDGDIIYNTEPMLKVGTVFNLELNATDLNKVGQYENTISCCAGTTCRANVLPFQVTPSGAQPLSQSQGTVLFLVLGVILFIAIIFFIIGFRSKNIVVKTSGFSGGVVMVFVLVLYTMFMINEAISGTPNLVSGYETFLMVMKIIGTVLIIGLMIVLGLVAGKAWKIRRGLAD